MLRRSIIAFALFASTVCAQSPVSLPAEPIAFVIGDNPKEVTLDIANKAAIALVNTSSHLTAVELPNRNPAKFKFIVWAKEAGTYEVVLMINGATADLPPEETARVKIVVTQPGPKPSPPVPVPPGPTPVPVPPTPVPPAPVAAQRLYLMVVEETAQASQNRAAYLTDKALTARIKERGHVARLIDQNTTPVTADIKPYLDKAKGQKLPRLFIVKLTGGVLWEGDLPATPADFIALIAKFGG